MGFIPRYRVFELESWLWPRGYSAISDEMGTPLLRYARAPNHPRLRVAAGFAVATLNGRVQPIAFLHGAPAGATEQSTIDFSPARGLGYDIYQYDQVGSRFSGELADVRQYTVGRICAS